MSKTDVTVIDATKDRLYEAKLLEVLLEMPFELTLRKGVERDLHKEHYLSTSSGTELLMLISALNAACITLDIDFNLSDDSDTSETMIFLHAEEVQHEVC